MSANAKDVITRLERIEAKFDALLTALGAQLVEESQAPTLADGFAAFAEGSRKRHAKGRG